MAALLAIVQRAHRGAVETQFADVFWVAREFHRQLGALDLLLRGTAVTAAVRDEGSGPDAYPQIFGTVPDHRESVRTLLADGVRVLVDAHDLGALGLAGAALLPGAARHDAACGALAWSDYDEVWFL